MKKIISKKNTYLLLLLVICLLGIVIVPTYAKFASNYTTADDVVGMSLSFDLSISSIEEYEEIVVPAGGSERFNVEITNNTGATVYYGVWYKMIDPDTLSSDISIGRFAGTDVSTSGNLDNNSTTTVSVIIANSSSSSIKVNIGVASSSTGIGDIEYLGGKYLITGDVSIIRDIMITSITIDGVSTNSLPTGGTYTMTSSCTKGSTLTWNTYNKNITYGAGSKVGDECSLTFTSSTNYPKLNTMAVGSYVAYTGSGGTVGSTNVSCQTNGSPSSSTASDETEAPNSCSGQNAREDLDTSNYTYGYCSSSNYKYYTTGWRIAYIKDSKVRLVSAGSPECNSKTESTANVTYIKTANAKALKYCNTNYVDGNCTCTDSDADGLCDSPSTDAWAINDTDFYYMTKAISGYGKRLADDSSGADSSLGDSGGALGTTLYCYGKYSYQECGYNNDLIDNGGFYWFAARYSSSDTYGLLWNPGYRYVYRYTSTGAYGLRPVISLSSTVYVTGGKGTMDDPYTIGN